MEDDANNTLPEMTAERTAREAHDAPTSRDPRFVTWAIPKAEWDGYIARVQAIRPNMTLIMAGAMAAFFTAGSFLLYLFAFPNQPTLLFVLLGGVAAIFIPMFVVFAVMRRNIVRWRARCPQIWDAHGCLCPLCLAPLCESANDSASCGHGFIVEDQPWIVRYFEAIAGAPEEVVRHHTHGASEMRALRTRARNRGTQPRGIFRRIARALRVVWDAWLGFDQPMWKRVVGHIALAALVVLFIAPFSWIGTIVLLWMGGFTFMGYRAIRSANHIAKRLHCAKCKQTLLSADRTTCCPECGTSLAEAGSVKTAEAKPLLARWALGVFFIFLGGWFPIYVIPMIGRALPNDALFALAERVPSIAPETFGVLSTRPLRGAEQRQLADLVLPHITGWARGQTNYRGREATYIAASVANGTLPIEYAERVARALCQLQVEVSYVADDGAVAEHDGVFEVDAERAAKGIKVRMRFIGFGEATNPQLGPTVGVLATLELDERAVWDATSSTPPALASDAVASIDLASNGARPTQGDHRILVRAFVAIAPDYKLITSFDQSGAPILPPKSLGPWQVERAHTLRIR